MGTVHRLRIGPMGTPGGRDFLGTDLKSARHELVSIASALRGHNEFDIGRLAGLLKVPTS